MVQHGGATGSNQWFNPELKFMSDEFHMFFLGAFLLVLKLLPCSIMPVHGLVTPIAPRCQCVQYVPNSYPMFLGWAPDPP